MKDYSEQDWLKRDQQKAEMKVNFAIVGIVLSLIFSAAVLTKLNDGDCTHGVHSNMGQQMGDSSEK